jgi:hypothetical protein
MGKKTLKEARKVSKVHSLEELLKVIKERYKKK